MDNTTNCLQCKKIFIKRSSRTRFCSKTCGIKHWRHSKRKPCPRCGKLIAYASKHCKRCNTIKWENHERTINELKEIAKTKRDRVLWFNATVRGPAAILNANRKGGPCEHCGYSLHTELCHIQDVKDFPGSATVGEINAPSNVAILCRNCHWEFDNGHLTL